MSATTLVCPACGNEGPTVESLPPGTVVPDRSAVICPRCGLPAMFTVHPPAMVLPTPDDVAQLSRDDAFVAVLHQRFYARLNRRFPILEGPS